MAMIVMVKASPMSNSRLLMLDYQFHTVSLETCMSDHDCHGKGISYEQHKTIDVGLSIPHSQSGNMHEWP